MSNLTITNRSDEDGLRALQASEQSVLQLAGADTIARLTILGRQDVDTAIVVTADAGNTGDGTVAAVVVNSPDIPLVGDYNVECIAAATNSGTFKIENPNGDLVLGDVTIPAGAGNDVVVVADGIQFTITDGATDFIVGDKFAAAVVANGDYVYYSASGAGGAQIPKAILLTEVVATGAGDFPIHVLLKGRVRTDKIIIDGSAAGVGITDAIKDALRDYGIIVEDATETAALDNQ